MIQRIAVHPRLSDEGLFAEFVLLKAVYRICPRETAWNVPTPAGALE